MGKCILQNGFTSYFIRFFLCRVGRGTVAMVTARISLMDATVFVQTTCFMNCAQLLLKTCFGILRKKIWNNSDMK